MIFSLFKEALSLIALTIARNKSNNQEKFLFFKNYVDFVEKKEIILVYFKY